MAGLMLSKRLIFHPKIRLGMFTKIIQYLVYFDLFSFIVIRGKINNLNLKKIK